MTFGKGQEVLTTAIGELLAAELQVLTLAGHMNLLMLILLDYSVVLNSLTLLMEATGPRSTAEILPFSKKISESKPTPD